MQCKDRIQVYPSVALCSYKRQREGGAMQRIVWHRIVNWWMELLFNSNPLRTPCQNILLCGMLTQSRWSAALCVVH